MFTGSLLNFPAMFIVALITTPLTIGISESANLNSVIVVTVILLFIWFGLFYIVPENLDPFIPESTGTFANMGGVVFFRASGIVFYAYLGFDAISTVAQEVKNPRRDMR